MSWFVDSLTHATDCPVDGCGNKVKPHGFREYMSAIFGNGNMDESHPWIADAPGSQTGLMVCDDHNYQGEYLG